MAEKCTLGRISVMVLLVLLCYVPEGQTNNNNSNRKGFTGLPNGDFREVELSPYPSETLNTDERIRRQTRYYNSHGDEDPEEGDVVDRLLEASSIRLASSSLGAEFSRGYIDLGQRDPVEEGAVSLAFVFDITGSMNDDMVQVIDGAGRILSTVLEKFERPIHNFVFVPFHDPEVGPVTVTTDPREFQASLRRSQLDIYGGGDCPEMALLAIKQALEVSLPSSYVYVFTDARAKDYHLLDDVLRIIERKQTQVVFVMTGDCGNNTHPGFQAFETIASTSSGQLFQLDKSDVKEVLSFVRVSLEARKVNLLSVDRESDGPGEENLPLLVDPTLKQFTISVSGQKPKIEIVGPEGETVGEPEGVENLLALDNVKIVGVKEPPPGRYNISVGSESKYTVRATGLSSLNFKHGFSLKPTINFKETYHHPMRGGTNYLLVQPVDVTEFGELYRLQLLSLDGEVLEDLPLTRLEGPGHVYNASAFTAPDHPFNIKLFGQDEHGFQFERISPTAVSSELPSKPEVSAERHVSGHHGHRTVITCHVQTLVPFTLHWQRDGADITDPQTYPQSAEVEYVVERAHSYDEGQYTCVATNIAGSTSANISLDVKEPPPQLYTRPSISLVPTHPAVLDCDVTSTVPYNLTWSRYVEQGRVQDFFGRMETIGKFVDVRELEGYRVLANNSLVLEEVTRDHKGWFRCTAMNEGGRVSREIEVAVLETPVVSVVPGRMPFRTGDNITLSCDVYGSPLPTLTWRRGNTILTEDGGGRIRVDQGGLYLHLHHARREDEGSYVCHASNSAGSAQSEGRLRYTEAPQVRATREDILVAIGDTAVLECHVTGIPPPDVHWLKDGTIDVTPLSFIQMDGPQLRITGVEETDAGQYTCMATNMVGTAQAEMNLRIGRPPTVVTAPSDTRVEIGASGLLVCYGSGEPQPNIHWYRDDGTPLPPHLIADNDGNLRITDMQVEDEGGYTCVIENRYGRRELHASLILTGLLAPLIAGPPNPNLPVLLGSPVTLPCVVVQGRPTPQPAWLHRGQPITPDSGIVVRADGSLSIPAIRMRDEGEYQCVATNLAGSSSLTLNLTILVPPRAKSGQAIEEVEVTEGAMAKLKCPVKANPRPKFSWYKDGRPLSGDPHRVRVVRGGVVVIRQVKESDAGTYVCTATNSVGNTTIPVVLNVLVPPSIRRDTESYTVNNGEKLDIPCKSSGRPQPSVSWARRQDRKLMWDNTLSDGTLRLVGSAEAEGEYDCVAANDAGSAKRSVIVQLSKPPKISPTGHETLTVEAGQDIKLPCEVEGLPTPRVTWQKERHLITTSDDLRPEPGYLLLHGAQPDTAGQYTCTATNIAGTATKAFTVHVNYAPIVTEEEQVWPEQSVVEGGQFTLPCPAHARPHPRRDWTKDGEQLVTEAGLSISTGGSVEVERATPVHGGHYRCTLTNTLGRAHIDYDVRILVPPRVASQLDTSIPQVVEGDEVAINCPVDAVPIPTIKWFKDGVSILSTKDRADMTHIIIEENGQTLHILDATIDDQGLYRCVAWNDAGETEMTVPLEVLVPPQFTQFFHVPEVTLKLGQYLHLDCGVNGDPEPQVVWKHNGVLLTDDDIGIGGQHVIVASAGIKNAGFYTCVAKNAAGTASRNFTVTVLMAPMLEENERESAGKRGLVAALSGDDSHLRCGITGSPIPTLSWTKDELPLRQWSDLEYSITDDYQVLTLHQVDPHYSGLYLCSGANALGETQRQFNVSVLSPPSMGESGDEDVVEELSVVVGDDITLSCPVNGFPPPSITWLRGGRALVSAPPYRVHPAPHLLQLSGVTQEEAGDYTCLATNRAGAAEKQFDLRIIVPARIVGPGNERESAETQPQQEVMVDMPFSLYCPATGSPTPHITWTKDDAPLVDLTGVGLSGQHVSVVDEGKRLLVAGASVRDSGNYTCTAANHAGSDSAVYQVSVLVPPLISVDETETIHSSVEGEKVVLECEVEGEPGPRVVWEQDGVALSDLQLPTVSVQDTLLTSNDGVTITKSEVHMESVGEQHAGTYTCLASSPAGSDQLSYIVRVATAPRLEEDWADGDDSSTNVITTHVNRPAVLSCKVHANPDPQIFWFKNTDPVDEMNSNVVISGDGRELRIIATDVDDAGNYTCLAVNEAGDIFLNFTLDVHVPPRLSGEVEEEVRVAVGDEATLVCPVYATPSPSILWMKDSDILPQSFISLEPRRLVVSNVSREDGGRYTCLATNEAGTLEQDFSLHVLVPPQLGDLEDPVIERAVVVNRPVTLSCLITADPPPSFTWLKDGEPLSSFTWTLDSTRRHLSLGRVKPEDAGNYTCVATNPAGTTTLTTTLSVLSPPTWAPKSDYEEDVTGVAGGVTSLHCDVTALPPPSLLWLRDGHVISHDPPNINLTQNDKVLVLSDVEESYGGRYVCVASNAAGTVEYEFQLTVHAPPSLTYHPLYNHTVVVNRATTLDCPVEGTPDPEVKWLVGGREVMNSGKYVRLSPSGRQLHLLRVLESMGGPVVCSAVNPAGHLVTEYNLEVLVPPSLTPMPPMLRATVMEGDTLRLFCRATGNPLPQVMWVVGEEQVLDAGEDEGGRMVHEGGQTLEVKTAMAEHQGSYTCLATNTAGSAQETFTVHVLIPPMIEEPESGTRIDVAESASVILSCPTVAQPHPEVTWFKNGEDLKSGRDPFLHVTGGGEQLRFLRVLASHAGNYTCLATNPAGQDALTYHLQVQVPPVIIEDSGENPLGETVGVVGGNIDLECYTLGSPMPSLTWTKDNQSIETGRRVSLEEVGQVLRVTDARVEDAGRYTCKAASSAGATSRDFVVVIHSPPRIVPPAEREVEAVAGRSLVLTCEAESSLTPARTWLRHGRPLSPFTNPNIQVRGGGQEMEIVRVRESDGGEYTCIVLSTAGQDLLMYTVVVQVPARIERANVRERVSGVAGKSLELVCEAAGSPPPTITWTHASTLITPDHPHYQILEDTRRLKIQEVEVGDEGIITCAAQNTAGKDSLNFTLDVLVAPHVPADGVTDIRVREGESVVLQCPVAATPGE
ncbi:hypothetical protein Pcinc_018676 [Petrolisthes cinctipes]|uniref:Ig-like domain-containing protein n=1 Tax=Petrolisthes cinctipes TaxID=88211 RepID=A0AAE1KM64_PETCI|nr:hypothetical protein Pcinc_018676 [Petrolisthes cinctipes]